MKFLILGALLVLTACKDESPAPPVTTLPPTTIEVPTTTTMPPTTTLPEPAKGIWVIVADDFGPCPAAPAGACNVGDKVSGHQSGNDGGCVIWECK